MTTSLVVAIEPDREQAACLSAIVRGRLGAELVLADSVTRALAALGDRIPDLILTPPLLSTRDDAALSARLRGLGPAAAHVQTVTVPRIGGVATARAHGGFFRRFRRSSPEPAAPEGCEPDVFAQQLSTYLQRAQAERAAAVEPEAVQEPAVSQPVSVPALEGYQRAPAATSERVTGPPIEEYRAAPSFEAIEPEPIALTETGPLVAPLLPSEPEPTEPIATTAIASPEPLPIWPDPIVEDVFVAAAPVEDVAAPAIVERLVAPMATVEDHAPVAPAVAAFVEPVAVVDQFVEPVTVVEEFVEPVPIVEEFVTPVSVVEEFVVPVAVVDEFVAPVAIVEEVPEPGAVVENPIAQLVKAADAVQAPSEPRFSVDDMELEFWIADEPEPAPVEALVIPPAQPDDDRFEIAARDFGEIDISSLLEGLILPDAAAVETRAPVPGAPAVTVAAEPAAAPARRKLPAKRHVPVHDRAPEPKAPRRRDSAPIQDEWGLFDPEQCGFAALLAKLDAVTDDKEMEKRRGTQARVISYN